MGFSFKSSLIISRYDFLFELDVELQFDYEIVSVF